jgi:hypothetical protein
MRRVFPLERYIFAKVEAWVVVLVATVLMGLAVVFGWVVLRAAQARIEPNLVGRFAIEVASVPETVKALLSGKDPRIAERAERFGDASGWIIADPAALVGLDGFILLSRFSGDDERAVVELVEPPRMLVRQRWHLDADRLRIEAAALETDVDLSVLKTSGFRATNPILLADGGLIVKDHGTPLFRLDACGQTTWIEATDAYHHSTETDAEGDIWLPSRIQPSDQSVVPQFVDDAITEVSPDGRRLQAISVTELMIENGMKPLLFTAGNFRTDPIHLNDVQPVVRDGPYWNKGDVFLSLRHLSMVMLVRPSTRKILWSRQGPWMAQHDVDILDDHTIAIYDNSIYDIGGGGYADPANEVLLYDFDTGLVRSPWKAAMEAARVVTLSEGLDDITPSGHLIVEESNSGRLVIFHRSGKIGAEYFNRDARGRAFRLAWSRYVPKAQGDAALAALAATTCPAPG